MTSKLILKKVRKSIGIIEYFFNEKNSPYPSLIPIYTDNRLPTISFVQVDTGKIIQNINTNKGHSHNISICMLKICSSTILQRS